MTRPETTLSRVRRQPKETVSETESVPRHDAERVEPRDDGRQDRVDERFADDDLDVEEAEPDDRVCERERDERHRHDAPGEIPVLAKERREEDGEDDERHDAGHGADQEGEDRPACGAVVARPPGVREREKAEDEVVGEEDPVERGRTVNQPPLTAAGSRARHLKDIKDGRKRVQESQEQRRTIDGNAGARRATGPRAFRRAAGRRTGTSFLREQEEECKKPPAAGTGRACRRPERLVDPEEAGRTQPADEEEHEENEQDVEDLHGGVVGRREITKAPRMNKRRPRNAK